jgi:hypothetical protein
MTSQSDPGRGGRYDEMEPLTAQTACSSGMGLCDRLGIHEQKPYQ